MQAMIASVAKLKAGRSRTCCVSTMRVIVWDAEEGCEFRELVAIASVLAAEDAGARVSLVEHLQQRESVLRPYHGSMG